MNTVFSIIRSNNLNVDKLIMCHRGKNNKYQEQMRKSK